MQTLVIVRGLLKRPDGPNLTKGQAFLIEHPNEEVLGERMQAVLGEVLTYQGLTIVADENKPKSLDNLEFWPMHNFRRIWLERKDLIRPYVEEKGSTQ
jgi:hypothetical protein